MHTVPMEVRPPLRPPQQQTIQVHEAEIRAARAFQAVLPADPCAPQRCPAERKRKVLLNIFKSGVMGWL